MGQPGIIDSDIPETLASRVFVAPDLVYPCVDLGVVGTDTSGHTVLVANVAGYPPGPFGKNWTGVDGPYVVVVGAPLLNGATIPEAGVSGVFGFVTPGFPAGESGA